jgi:integrase
MPAPRTTFSVREREQLLAAASDPADRVALRLLLDYGLRKGALRSVRLRHFDWQRRRLWILTKNGKQQILPLVDASLWQDLACCQGDYLLCRRRQVWRGYTEDGGSRFEHKRYPALPMGVHGLHCWWYGRLEAAALVEPGTRSGQRMHKARHTAGQRVLDATGNLKAVQKLLGHADISTTANIYLDWDIDALAQTMQQVLDAA